MTFDTSVEITNPDGIHGFKAFHQDWTCRPKPYITKQYTCPGIFETMSDPSVCNHGMHFCRRLEDVFNYYSTHDQKPRVAEVIAWGKVVEAGDKCSTNKLEIVREIPWEEVVIRVNTGHDCSGICNTGNCNTGNCNTGNWNTGNRNTGDWNTGNCNTGNWNTGDWNTGNCNTGNRNTGNRNTGNRNTGDWNTGDWNKTNFSAGCFCTEESEMLMFNKPSGMTYREWWNHPASILLNRIPKNVVEWVCADDMTEEEKAQNPTYETTGGYVKVLDESECTQPWWDSLGDYEREIILGLPNFDADIFRECTGIKVD